MATKVVKNKEYSMDEIDNDTYMASHQPDYETDVLVDTVYDDDVVEGSDDIGTHIDTHIDEYSQEVDYGDNSETEFIDDVNTGYGDEYSQIPYPHKRK